MAASSCAFEGRTLYAGSACAQRTAPRASMRNSDGMAIDRCFSPEAFSRSIASDDMGKEALKAALKKIVIQNSEDISYAGRAITFSDGVLTVDHAPTTNAWYVDDRANAIREKLEKAL